MNTLIPILILSLIFSRLTERTTIGTYGNGTRQTAQNQLFFWVLILTLALPVGLRRIYNDTGAYIRGFEESMTLAELVTSEELHILANPLFDIYTAIIHDLTDNYHVYFMIPAIFVQAVFVSAIRKYSPSLVLGVGVYICLGTHVFSLAAMKQTIAMAILMLAIPKLLDRKYLWYYVLVFVAFLFHTYAIAYAILPLFVVKPWKIRTFILLITVILVMENFESVIGSFLDYANEQGKSLAEYEVFDNIQVNNFRVIVYAVVPVMSLVLRPYLFRGEYDESYHVLIHMSIFSFAFMSLGTINGANMFGRMANYFEMGTVCSMVWMIRRSLSRSSAKLVTAIGACCFLYYFYYAYAVAKDFDAQYRAITIWEFFQSLFAA